MDRRKLPRMKRTLLLLMWWCTAVASASPSFMLGGIQINEGDQDRWSATLRDAGFNTLQVTVYARQPEWDSPELLTRPIDPGTVEKIRAARRAGLDVALILRLETDHAYPKNRFLWHGLVCPLESTTLDAWFDRYAAFVLQWSELAEREGVAVLGLGSEINMIAATRPLQALPTLEAYYLDSAQQTLRRERLLAQADRIPPALIRAPGDASPVDNLRAFMEARDAALYDWAAAVTYDDGHTPLEVRLQRINDRRSQLRKRWGRLIDDVRSRYAGRLTYAANFDNYQDVTFWGGLDLMGINAYFPLREPGQANDADTLAAGWHGVWDQIETQQATMGVPGMPVVFTELGYTRRADCTTAPWAWQGFELVGEEQTLMVWETLPMDPGERVRSIQALHAVHRQRRTPLAGLLYWKLTASPDMAAIEPFALRIEPRDRHDTLDDAGDALQPALLQFLAPDEARDMPDDAETLRLRQPAPTPADPAGDR